MSNFDIAMLLWIITATVSIFACLLCPSKYLYISRGKCRHTRVLPTNPKVGDVYHDSIAKNTLVYSDGKWIPLIEVSDADYDR